MVHPHAETAARLRLRKKSPLHTYYPVLFHPAFPEVPKEKVQELAMADRLYTEHLLAQDAVLDQKDGKSPAHWLVAHLEHMHSLKRLYRLFPCGHAFWDLFTSCFHETWQSVRTERLHHLHRIQPFSHRRFRTLAKGKTALLKPFTMALCFLSNRECDLALLSETLDLHHIGLVFLDDLEDWREDFLRGNHTHLLTTLIDEQGLHEEVLQGLPIPLSKVASLLYGSGLAEKQLKKAQTCFKKAMKACSTLFLPDWQSFHQALLRHCSGLHADIEAIRRRGCGKRKGSSQKGQHVTREVRHGFPRCRTQEAHARGKASSPAVHLHTGLPAYLRNPVAHVLEWWQATFPQHLPDGLYLGHWPSMPPHFICRNESRGQVAVNASPPFQAPGMSTAARPLMTEAMMACVAEARLRYTGVFKDNLERVYASGFALWMLERMGFEGPVWDLAGAKKLHWLWCEEQEEELWEWLLPRLGRPHISASPFLWLLPIPGLLLDDPIPACMPLYLGLRIFQALRSRSLLEDPAVHLSRDAASIRKDLGRYGLFTVQGVQA